MSRPSRIAKRLLLPVLLAATFVVVQVVLAQPPVASFNVTAPPGNTCGTYSFASTSTDPDNDIASTVWDLGGTAANGSPVTATFGTPGSRNITMTVTDAAGGDDATEDPDTASETINVVNEAAPNAVLSGTPNPAQPNQTVTFSAAGSADSGNGSIAKYEWDMDGNNSYEANTGLVATNTAAFATAGPHTVRVRVTDNCGATDLASDSVFVNNTPPAASFIFTPSPAAVGQSVSFNGTASSDTGGSIAKYEWSFDGDDQVFEVDGGATATTPHTFDASGSYLVYLRVTDNDGASTTTSRLVRVNAKPTANFSFTPNAPLVNEPVSFNAAASADGDGTIASYEWDLDGNGTFETTQTSAATPATHTYAAAGTVNVKLRVTDNNGAFDELTRQVTVLTTRPNVGFDYSPKDPLPGQAVTLTSTSSPSASPGAPSLVDTQWDFAYSPLADFTIDAAGGSIVTSFATPGAHTVAIKVTETGGGFDIKSLTINVNAPPQASFTVAPTKPTEGTEVTFASTSNDPDGPLVKQEWDLDNDGKYDDGSGVVASTTKLKKGTRPVRLRVTDSKGATSVSNQTVTVGAKPLKAPVRIRRRIGFAPRDWGIELVVLFVKVPAKTTVIVKCLGHGCPHGSFTKRSKKKAATLRFDKLQGSVRAGGKITVLSKRTGHISGFDTYLVRGKKRGPQLREQCMYPGKKKPRACPNG